MLKKEVTVTIHGTQVTPDGEVSKSHSTAAGVLSERGGKKFLLFSEKDEDGAITNSVIKYTTDRIQIVRSGQISSTFTFSEKEHCRSSYIAPYGSFFVDIDTERYVLEEKPASTRIMIGYRLTIEEEHTAQCLIELEIREENHETEC